MRIEINLPQGLPQNKEPRHPARNLIGTVRLQPDDLRVSLVWAADLDGQPLRYGPAQRVADIRVETNVDSFRPPVGVDGVVEKHHVLPQMSVEVNGRPPKRIRVRQM